MEGDDETMVVGDTGVLRLLPRILCSQKCLSGLKKSVTEHLLLLSMKYKEIKGICK